MSDRDRKESPAQGHAAAQTDFLDGGTQRQKSRHGATPKIAPAVPLALQSARRGDLLPVTRPDDRAPRAANPTEPCALRIAKPGPEDPQGGKLRMRGAVLP